MYNPILSREKFVSCLAEMLLVIAGCFSEALACLVAGTVCFSLTLGPNSEPHVKI